MAVSLLLWGHGTVRKLLALHRRAVCALIQGLSAAGGGCTFPDQRLALRSEGGGSEPGCAAGSEPRPRHPGVSDPPKRKSKHLFFRQPQSSFFFFKSTRKGFSKFSRIRLALLCGVITATSLGTKGPTTSIPSIRSCRFQHLFRDEIDAMSEMKHCLTAPQHNSPRPSVGLHPPPLTTESPTTHYCTVQHHVPIDPRVCAERMPRAVLTRSVTQ